MNYEFPIPILFIGFSRAANADIEKQRMLFRKYVLGYVKRTYPDFDFVRIEGMKIICEKVRG